MTTARRPATWAAASPSSRSDCSPEKGDDMLIHSPWATLQPYPTFTLPEYLEHAAHRFEDKACLVNMDGTEYTFGRVWEAGKRLGRFLQDQGIQKGDPGAGPSANAPGHGGGLQGTAH